MDREILDVRFNQDVSSFVSSMEYGFRVFNVEPLVELETHDRDTVGSIAMCQPLYRADIFMLVCGGYKPKYPNNWVLFYSASRKEFMMTTRFQSAVRAIRFKKDKYAVSLARKMLVFSFPAAQQLFSIDLKDNVRGLLEMPSLPRGGEREIVLFPGNTQGSLQILDITTPGLKQSTCPLVIECHKSKLMCIAVNPEGTKVVTASEKGTLIRIWDTATKAFLAEFRRGCDGAKIYSLAFSSTSEYVCVSSDKGTVHIFSVFDPSLNRKELLGSKSFAHFSLPPEKPCVIAFRSNNCVVAISKDGKFNKWTFTKEGHCHRAEFDVFLDLVRDPNIKRKERLMLSKKSDSDSDGPS